MINLNTFFKNHLDSVEVSDANFYKFVEDHISRLKANNDSGVYATMYDNTLSLFNSYGAALSQEDTQYTQQQGSTISVDTIIAAFKTYTSRTEGLINFIFGVKSAEYQDFFPAGVTEYSQATKANIEVLMRRMVVKTQKYVGKLGSEVVTQFETFYETYTETRRSQLENIGRVTANRSQTEETRVALSRQVMSNLLVIANQFLGNPERGMDFFDQSIIRRNNYSTDEGESATNTVSSQTTQTIFKGFDKSSSFILSNLGATSLRFSISTIDNTAPAVYGITISPGDTITASVFELNPDGGDRLNVTNLDSETTGKYNAERLP